MAFYIIMNSMDTFYDDYSIWLNEKLYDHSNLEINKFHRINVIVQNGKLDVSIFNEINKLEDSFIHVKNNKHYVHIYLFVYRMYHPTTKKPTLEIVDSTADISTQIHPIYDEKKIRKKCDELGITYLGNESMYGDKIKDNRQLGGSDTSMLTYYEHAPPQSLANLFINSNKGKFDYNEYKQSLEEYNVNCESVVDYNELNTKRLREYIGGSCIFWSYLISSRMVQDKISSKEWMSIFKEHIKNRPMFALSFEINEFYFNYFK